MTKYILAGGNDRQSDTYGVMVHYGSYDGGFNNDQKVDWLEAENRLIQALPKDMNILRIKEGGFFVLEQ